MTQIRWAVYPAAIPLSGRPTELGVITAPDEATALTRAIAAHGPNIVVQSITSRTGAERVTNRHPRSTP